MFCPGCGASVSAGLAFCASCGAKISLQAPFAAPQAAYVPQLVVGYATWGDRVVGYLIDQLLVAAGVLVCYLLVGGAFAGLIGGVTGSSDAAGGVCCMFLLIVPLASLAVGLFNRVYLVSKRGCSIGQGVMNLKVIDAQGQLLTQGAALIRLLAQIGLAILPFGAAVDLLWPLWDERRQTLHDKAVGCYVIKTA